VFFIVAFLKKIVLDLGRFFVSTRGILVVQSSINGVRVLELCVLGKYCF
jgi:hypothetical protein